MDATLFLTISASLVAGSFGILSVVIGWVGSRVINKQDEMMTKLDNVRDDLYKRINVLDLRLTRVELILDDEK